MDDSADRHVARWRDHWVDVTFDDAVEAMTVRISVLSRFFRRSKQRASSEAGLQEFEYDTLHRLMIRDTPGRASPTDLAEAADVSAAGMTGRLDSLERAGYIQRVPSKADRRRVDIEATKSGIAVWRRAMALRGDAEEELATALTPRELATLNRLLKKLVLHIEQQSG